MILLKISFTRESEVVPNMERLFLLGESCMTKKKVKNPPKYRQPKKCLGCVWGKWEGTKYVKKEKLY